MNRMYGRFEGVVKVGIVKRKDMPEIKVTAPKVFNGVQQDGGTKSENHGSHNLYHVLNVDGTIKSTRTSANVFIEANGAREYLRLDHYVEAGKVPQARVYDKDTNEVSYVDEALGSDEAVLSRCADWAKKSITLNGETFETISQSQFIERISQLANTVEGLVYVRGSITVNHYNGKTSLRYEPTSFSDAKDGVDEYLKLTLDAVYAKGAVAKVPHDKFLSGAKVNVGIFLPVQERVAKVGEQGFNYVDKIVKVPNLFELDTQFATSKESYDVISSLLETNLAGNQLVPTKFYNTDFTISVMGAEGSVSANEFNFQERRMLDMGIMTKEQIIERRPMKPKTVKRYVLSPMISRCEMVDIKPNDIYGNNTQPTISAGNVGHTQPYGMPTGISQATVQTTTHVTPTAPSVVGGIDMTKYMG